MSESVILEKLDNIEKKINAISVVVTGNGSTDRSLVVRLATLEESVDNCQAQSAHKRAYREQYTQISKRGQVAIICSSIAACTSVVVALIALLK